MKDLKSNLASKIDRIFAITIIVLLSIYSLVLTYYTQTLQDQLYERDILIEKLAERDSILNEIFTISYDSLNNSISYSYIERDGEVVKYDVLAKNLDDTRVHLIQKSELLDEALYVSNDFKEELIVSQGKYDTLVYEYNKLVGMYNKIGKDYNSNFQKVDSVLKITNASLDSLSFYRAISKSIEDNYGFIIMMDTKTRKLQITNPSLDSALILYPYFKDRLTFDSTKNVWVIELERTKK